MTEETNKATETISKQKIQISLTPQHLKKLDLLAQAKGVTLSELLRTIAEQWTLEHYIDEFAFWSADLT
tara:strand:- start:1531 stop:1737 length:207 start_codon:yes stop_codon:yes gene_type:complete